MEDYSVRAILSASDKGFESKINAATKSLEGLESQGEKSRSSIIDIAAGQGVFKLMSKGVDILTSSLDGAIDRFDTMNRFPKIMQQIGFSSEEAEASVDKLSSGIQGLPTTLDGIISSTQKLALLTGDLDKATYASIALNDAFFASGASTADAERGLVQYTQMLSKGTVDIMSWRTLQETMGVALNELAAAFGYAGESAQNDLYAALQSGEITFNQLNDKLIELDGGVNGFAERARSASVGIKTSFTNLGTSVVRGVEGVIRTVDTGLSESGLPNFNEMLGMTKEKLDSMFYAAQDGAGKMVDVVAPAVKLVGDNIDIITSVLGVGTAGFAAYKGAMMISDISQKFSGEMALAKVRIEAVTSAEELSAKAKELSRKATEANEKAARAAEIADSMREKAIKATDEAIKARTAAETLASQATKTKSEADKMAELEDKARKAEEIAAKKAIDAKSASEREAKAAISLKTKEEKLAAAQTNKRMSVEKASGEVAKAKASLDKASATAVKKKEAADKAATAAEALKTKVTESDTSSSILNARATSLEESASKAKANADKLEAAAQAQSDIAKRADAQASVLNAKAETADTAATMANSEAEAVSSVMITAKTALLGVLSGKIGVATAAQLVWNAAIAANPIGIAIAAVAAFIAVIAGLSVALSRLTPEEKEVAEQRERYVEETKELVDALKDERKTREDAAGSIEAEAAANEKLAGNIAKLSGKEKKSAKEKAELKAYVDALNKSLDDLNLVYDEQADALNMTTKEINEKVRAHEQETKIQQAQEEYSNVLKRQAEVEERLSELSKEKQAILDENAKKISNEIDLQRASNVAAAEQSKQIEELKKEKASLAEEEEYYKNIIVKSNKEQADAVSQNVESQKVSLDELTDAQEDAKDRILEAYETMTGGLSDLSKKIEQDSELTWNKVKQNQQDAITQTQEFATLYAQLIDAGVSESYLNAIGATGPEALPLLQGMMEGGIEEVLSYQSQWQDAYDSIGTAFKDSLEMNDDVRSAVKEFILGESGVYGTLQSEIDSADFSSLSKDVVSGYAEGFKDTSDVKDGITNMCEDGQDAARTADDSHSPSRKYKSMGEDAARGYILGFEGKSSALNSAIQNVLSAAGKIAVKEVKSLRTELYDSGYWAAIGLARGMDSGIGEVASAAARLADKVAQTINARLDIGSPSKVTWESGGWTTIGLAKGMIEKLRYVERASVMLAEAAVPTGEIASRVAYAGSSYIGEDYEYVGDYSGHSYTIIVPVEIEGREVARVTAPYTQEELARMERMNNRKKGYR